MTAPREEFGALVVGAMSPVDPTPDEHPDQTDAVTEVHAIDLGQGNRGAPVTPSASAAFVAWLDEHV